MIFSSSVSCGDLPLGGLEAPDGGLSRDQATLDGGRREDIGFDDGPFEEVVCDAVPMARLDDFLVSLEGCTIVNGYIAVDAPTSKLRSLNALRVLNGGFGMFQNLSVETLDGLQQLREAEMFTIIGGKLRSVSALRSLRHVGFLRLSHTSLQNLDGLESLTTIGKEAGVSGLDIGQNQRLVSLRGLSGLTRVEGDLYISGNPMLPREEVDWLLDRIEVGGEIRVD